MITTPQLVILTATLAFSAGGLAMHEIMHLRVTAVCTQPAPSDDGMKAFLAKPDAPLTGYPRY